MTLDELLLEWSYRTNKGYPSMDNPSDISILKEILQKLNLPTNIINELGSSYADKDGKPGTTGLEPSEYEDEEPSPIKTLNNPPLSSKDISIEDIIDILPKIKTDQEALLKIKKFIINRKGEVGFFDRLTLKNINDATIDSSNAPRDLFQILSDNDDVQNYDIFDQPNFTELGKSGNLFNFYESHSDLSRKSILKLFDYFGTEGGRGVGRGEMAFALLFKDVKMSTGAGDLDWNGQYLEVKGSQARLGGRERGFSGFEKSSLGQLTTEYDKSDKNLVSLIPNLANEEGMDLNKLLEAVINFEDEAHPNGDALKYFNINNIQDPPELRKAFLKNYIINYSNEHGVDHFIWWNSKTLPKSAGPELAGTATKRWGSYVIFTPMESDGLVDNNEIASAMPKIHDLDPTLSRP